MQLSVAYKGRSAVASRPRSLRGGVATIAYRGLFGGNNPPDNAGDILMESWLVVYR